MAEDEARVVTELLGAGWWEALRAVGWGFGSAFGEIPAAERGYDGSWGRD